MTRMGRSVVGSSLGVLRAVSAGIDPEGFFRRRATEAAPFTLRFPGLGEVLFVSTKEGAREILTAPASVCTSPRPNPIESIVGEGSLILLSGEHHRRMRGLLTPPLRGEHVLAYVDVIAAAAAEAVEPLQPGDTVAVRELARVIALDVIIRVVFGVTDRQRRKKYVDSITALMEANTAALMLVPALRRPFGGFGPWARLVPLRAQLDQLLSEEIEQRRAAHLDSQDLLNLLLTVTDEEGRGLDEQDIHEQLRTLLAAGHETSATALAWAIYHIHRDDGVRQRLLDELSGRPAPREMAELPYLGAVISETLRMHPTVPIVVRRLSGPLTVRGIACGEGDTVGIALPALHFNPTLWPNPKRFDPDRFLTRRPSPFQYAPFGGGHRRCIGSSFATCELAVAIGTIMSSVDLRMSDRERHRNPPRTVPRGLAAVPNRSMVLETIGRIPSGDVA